jgi:outer membrane protein assembly factor BamD (BamD/ComL family)
MNRKISYILLFLLLAVPIRAEKPDLIKLAELSYSKTEYYSTITSLMRYQYLFPRGKYSAQSMLLMGKAYYRGDNFRRAAEVLTSAYSRFADQEAGEESLYILGRMRLITASPFFALRSFQEYLHVYEEGRFREDAFFNTCYSYALSPVVSLAQRKINEYRKTYPQGKYLEEADKLEKSIQYEINRPKKSAGVSVAGSIFLPGFGHFYTGNYSTGFLSLFTNALLIYLIYDGYRNERRAQMLVSGFAELTFYQHSIYEGIKSVNRYNSREEFYRQVRLSIGTEF